MPRSSIPPNSLNKLIREALPAHPVLRTAALKLVTARAASSGAKEVVEGLCSILLASRVAQPRVRSFRKSWACALFRLAMKTGQGGRGGKSFHISEFSNLNSTDFNLMRYWGLIEKAPSGKRGWWSLARIGAEWIAGGGYIPEAIQFNGGEKQPRYSPAPKIGDRPTTLISFREAIGESEYKVCIQGSPEARKMLKRLSEWKALSKVGGDCVHPVPIFPKASQPAEGRK